MRMPQKAKIIMDYLAIINHILRYIQGKDVLRLEYNAHAEPEMGVSVLTFWVFSPGPTVSS